jgi:hypothetical protein
MKPENFIAIGLHTALQQRIQKKKVSWDTLYMANVHALDELRECCDCHLTSFGGEN